MMTASSAPRRAASLAAVAGPAGDRILATARRTLAREAAAILDLQARLNDATSHAALAIAACAGHVVVSGHGKSHLIGQKISATFASLGTPSFAVHAADLVHGDLGRLARGDLMVVLSLSGELPELAPLAAHLRRLAVPLVAITGGDGSPLARAATWTLFIGTPQEAYTPAPAPTASSAAMLAMGDALAVCAAECRGVRRETFAAVHPGGSLGARLTGRPAATAIKG